MDLQTAQEICYSFQINIPFSMTYGLIFSLPSGGGEFTFETGFELTNKAQKSLLYARTSCFKFKTVLSALLGLF